MNTEAPPRPRPGPPSPPGRVIRGTALSVLFPGLGHLRPEERLAGLLLAALFGASGGVAIYHLAVGLTLFESALGAFLFGVLLRSALVIWGFAAVDSYLRSTGQGETDRRAKTLANFLIPGLGYLLDRAWFRAASSTLVLIVVIFIARRPIHYLPLIALGFRLITAFGLYQQKVTAHYEATRDHPAPPHVDPIPAGQIILLVQLMAATTLIAWTLKIQIADYPDLRLTDNDVNVQRRLGSIVVTLPKRHLTFTTPGRGWSIQKGVDDGAFFRARQHLGATLVAGMQPILPFVRPGRYLLALRRQITSSGYRLDRQQNLILDGHPATQLRFSRQVAGMTLDRWAIAIPQEHVAYVLLLSCGRKICEKLLPAFEKTRDSLRITASSE